ncbi:Na/Pi cotransporter family protein [Geobacter benzoatilyticus]|uniref:Na/Pi cotransporter family protein n=1 Tax=Geobacter benzoatilyticus TaxID=2815309 RepID=A0ABX7Q1G0_9BACT|nr:Na/Pi cotransporter family protein [Geobacter benzoatilyticus]QSV45232.1 Na/Pi cotransporter family protein [Geobacter benzoatilyticus]
MTILYVLEALGGLGLFILGMKTMTDGLQKLAGDKFRRALERVAGNRLAAALLGSSLSSLLQSSSAACIITIGFVNAGLISLYQALGILLGTGIGTTLAVQFIAFKITSFALPAIFAGVLLRFFVRRRRWVNAGELLLGAGLLFLGLRVMEANLQPLQQNAIVLGHDTFLISKHFTSVLFGALLTLLVQSGSTAIGIVMALAGSGLISFETGAAMVIGELVGTSVITAFASIGGTIEAKRAVFFYFVINIFAVTVVMIFFPSFIELVRTISPAVLDSSTAVSRVLANTHTVFSILSACIFLPLIGFFARSASHIIPGSERTVSVEARTIFIDNRVINTPPIALLQARNELRRMADITRSMYCEMAAQFVRYDAKKSVAIEQKENAVDIIQRDLSDFLVNLSRNPLPPEETMDIPVMLQLISELEHVADQSEAILDYLRKKKEEKLVFSTIAMTEIRHLSRKVEELVVLAAESVESPVPEALEKGRGVRDEVVQMREAMLNGHIKRLSNGKCTVRAGIIFADMIAAFAKISDSCLTIIETRREFA